MVKNNADLDKIFSQEGRMNKYSAELFLVEIFDFSGSSDDLSVDFSAPLAGEISRPAVDRRVHLFVKLAHVFYVKEAHFISFVGGEAIVLVAGLAGEGVFHLFEGLFHSIDKSSGVFLILGERVEDALKRF